MSDQKTTAELMMEKGYLQASDVARKVGKSTSAVYGWVKEGKIKSMKVGASTFVLVSSLVAYLGEDACVTMGIITRKKKA